MAMSQYSCSVLTQFIMWTGVFWVELAIELDRWLFQYATQVAGTASLSPPANSYLTQKMGRSSYMYSGMAAGNATGMGSGTTCQAIIRIILEYRHCQLLLHIMDLAIIRHHSTKQKFCIDTKMDDGLPQSGAVLALQPSWWAGSGFGGGDNDIVMAVQ